MSVTASQMDYVLPNELVDGMIAAGGKKATVSVKNLLLRGFYSGAILGLAVILALTVGIQSKMPFLGSVLFPFGFVSIVLFGMELVTGNFALLPMATWPARAPGVPPSATGVGSGSATSSAPWWWRSSWPSASPVAARLTLPLMAACGKKWPKDHQPQHPQR